MTRNPRFSRGKGEREKRLERALRTIKAIIPPHVCKKDCIACLIMETIENVLQDEKTKVHS